VQTLPPSEAQRSDSAPGEQDSNRRDRNEEKIERSLEELFTMYYRSIHLFLLRLVKDEELALELTQETFYRACRAFSKTHEGTMVHCTSAWLYQIARHLAYDTFRQRQYGSCVPLDLDIYDPPQEGNLEEQVCLTEHIHAALECLPEGYRQALQLLGEGYSYGEIAHAVGVAPGGIKMYISRARRRFREQFLPFK
jgi:RNA polymerase sigma-70 factor (ECF subfamily)